LPNYDDIINSQNYTYDLNASPQRRPGGLLANSNDASDPLGIRELRQQQSPSPPVAPPSHSIAPPSVGTIDGQLSQLHAAILAEERNNPGSQRATLLRQHYTQLLNVRSKMPRAQTGVPSPASNPFAGAPVHDKLAQTPGTLEYAMRQLDGQVSWRSSQQRTAVLQYLYRKGAPPAGLGAGPVISPHLLNSTLSFLKGPDGGMNNINVSNTSYVNRKSDPRSKPLPASPYDQNKIVPPPAMSSQENMRIHSDIHMNERSIHDLEATLQTAPPAARPAIQAQIEDHRRKLSISFGNLGYNTNGVPRRVGDPWYEFYKSVGDKAQATANDMIHRGAKETDYVVRKQRAMAAAVNARLTGGAPPAEMPLPVDDEMRAEYRQHLHEVSEQPFRQANEMALGTIGEKLQHSVLPMHPHGKQLTADWIIYGRPPGLPSAIANADDPYLAIEQYHPSDREVLDWANQHADDLRKDANKTGGERFNDLMQPFKPVEDLLDAGVGHAHDLIGHYATGKPIGDYMNNGDRDAENEATNDVFHRFVDPLLSEVMVIPKVWHTIGNIWSFGEDPKRTIKQFVNDEHDTLVGPFKPNLTPLDRLYKTVHLVNHLIDVFDDFKDTKEGLTKMNIILRGKTKTGLSLGEMDAIYRRIDEEVQRSKPEAHGMQKVKEHFSRAFESQAPLNSRVQRAANRFAGIKNVGAFGSPSP
jgi:hypothetical protein